jgi:hypothetical protein
LLRGLRRRGAITKPRETVPVGNAAIRL